MNRRTHLKALLAGAAATGVVEAQSEKKGIQLFVEMEVDPAKEKEMLDSFHNSFLPEAKKHQGFIALKMLKLRQVVQGPKTAINYRFELTYENEELRQKWIASPGHAKVWPPIERTLKSTKDYPVYLFDEV